MSHGHAFIQRIIEDVEDKENVSEISIELGELAGIEADHLKEHLEEETGWKVNVVEKLSLVECPFCKFKGRAKILQRLHDLVLYSCEKCGKNPRVLEGKEIKITKVLYN